MLPDELYFDLVLLEEASVAHELELSGYPADEAASFEAFQYRLSNAPELFLGAFLPAGVTADSENDKNRSLIGYVCATLSSSPTLTHQSMSTHEPSISSASVCIHSVCVLKEYRRRGIAKALLEEYITRLEKANANAGTEKYARLLIIAHEELLGLYQSAGFEKVGLSEVQHGSRPWYELRRTLSSTPYSLSPSTNTAQDQIHLTSSHPGIWEALQRSSRNRPAARSFSSFSNPQEFTVSEGGNGALTNKYDLFCPRAGCGSIILKGGVAEYIEGPTVELEPFGRTPADPLPAVSSESSLTNWWLIKPSPLSFENIGFSKSVPSTTGPKKKFLICAECDLGPLGWCVEGGSEFWLACDRVGYRE